MSLEKKIIKTTEENKDKRITRLTDEIAVSPSPSTGALKRSVLDSFTQTGGLSASQDSIQVHPIHTHWLGAAQGRETAVITTIVQDWLHSYHRNLKFDFKSKTATRGLKRGY